MKELWKEMWGQTPLGLKLLCAFGIFSSLTGVTLMVLLIIKLIMGL